ncbi:kinetochore-associated protein 1 [Palaemon carinicauda]|uniref:kinetochore-associated protein 1 n=1 Tax=Palaemon carinicauda TaxID=392227 RepID=UPI0035B5AF55
MVHWDVLDADCDEETRQAGDVGSLISLYEVVKLAYLQPDDKLIELPQLATSAAYGRVAVALDSTVFVFGEGCSTLLMKLAMQAVINIAIWVPSGDFLILGDCEGGVHCVHIESQQVLITKRLPINSDSGKLFISGGSEQGWEGKVSVTLVTCYGHVVGIRNIDLEGLSEGLKLGDQEHLKAISDQMAVSMDAIDLNGSQLSTGSCLFRRRREDATWLWGSKGKEVIQWMSSSLHDHSTPFLREYKQDSQINRVIPIFDGRYVLTLHGSGKLAVLCGVTGIMLLDEVECEHSILDIVFLEGDESTAQVLLVLKDEKSGGCILRIMSFPGFATIYELNVNDGTNLVEIGEGAESVLFVEPDVDRNDREVFTSLKVKSIVDGVPEARLAKLLRSRKFTEAMEFCKTFKLDVEEVNKAHARYLCDLMNPWRIYSNATLNEAECEDRTEKLLESLGTIRDVEFVTTLCVDAPLPDLATTKKILNYAKERLAGTAQSEEGDKLSSLMQQVSESTYRLRTFETIFPASDIQHWLAFSRTDMLEEFILHLQKGNLDVASTVWHRHLYEFGPSIDIDKVSEILSSFPFNMSSEKLCNWLPRNVISDLVKLCPDSMEVIATWGDKRVKDLECLEKEGWPSNGLALANTVISILENVVADFHAGGNIEVQMAVHVAQWKAHSPSSALYHLRQTSLALQDMQLLADKFRVKIGFHEYTQEDKVAVVASILDWLVSGEEVAPLMDGFLRSYLIRHGLEHDTTLAYFIRETLGSADQDWWVWQEAQWEDKVYAVVNIITDIQLRVECIIECVHIAPVPWSEGTKAMCDAGLALNTSLSMQLEDQRQLVGLKLVLRRHSLHLYNIDNPQLAESMLRNIVNREGDTIMEDALQVVAAYKHLTRSDAYFWRALHLLMTGNPDALKTLLQQLEDSQQKIACQKLIIYATQTLHSPPRNRFCKEKRKSMTTSLLGVEAVLKKWYKDTGTLLDKNFFSTVRDIHEMQLKYDIFPTLRELEDSDVSLKLFEKYLNEKYMSFNTEEETREKLSIRPGKSGDVSCFEQSVNPSKFTSKPDEAFKHLLDSLEQLQHLAHLLGVSKVKLLFLLASLSAKNNKFEDAVKLCRTIMDESQVLDCSAVVQDVVKLAIEIQSVQKDEHANQISPVLMDNTALLEQGASIKCRADLNNVVLELVSMAMVFSHPDQLISLLEVGMWCQLGSTLYSQCHVEGIYTQHDFESSSPYTRWKFSAVYNDNSMPIEDGVVNSMLADALALWMTSQDKQESKTVYPYVSGAEEMCSSMDNEALTGNIYNLIGHLSERGQDLLTMTISLRKALRSLLFSPKSSASITSAHGYQQVLNLLLKIIGSKKPDVILAVSLLTLLTKKDASKGLNELIRRFGADYTKLISVAVIGKDYCTLNGIREVWEKFSVLHKRSLWGKRLSDMNISFKEAFRDTKAVSKVLDDVVAHPDCSFSLIYEYCEDFGLDLVDAFILHLRVVLQLWSPEVPEEGKRPGTVPKIEPPLAVFTKAEAIIAEISNKSHLLEMLSEELNNISSYNYEILELVLQQLKLLQADHQEMQLLTRGLDIVNFLKVYPRQCPPGDVEIDDWISTHPQSLGPPEISKYRLPFHELFKRSKSMKKIIEAELNISTIDIWLKAAPTLKLNADQLCMIATQNTVSSTLEQESVSRKQSNRDEHVTWHVCSTNSALLSKIRSVVSKIQFYELATACGNWVVNRLPPGLDKVLAAEKCKIMAEEWKEEQNSNSMAADAFASVSSRYQQLALEHALHKYNLAEPKYLALTRTPMELIFALYQHSSLGSLATLSTHSMPDINGCVSDICTTAGLRQVAIQLDLLEKWLPPSEASEVGSGEETVANFKIAFDPVASSEDTSPDDVSLSRVIYLLRYCPQEEAVSYLLNRALTGDTSVSASHRLRALRCLLAIADEKTIQKCSGKSISFIRTFLQTVTYVSRLESLGHATSVEQFNAMDKVALVEGLWRSQRHNPLALTLVTDLCHDYKVTTASLWGAVLTQLTNFFKLGQVDNVTLERVLLQINTLPHLWVVPALTTAWSTIIVNPFLKASYPVGENSFSACVHSVDLLLRHCPVVVPTAPLLKHCANLDLPVLGLAIAAADQVETHNLKAMADKTPTATLKEGYKRLKTVISLPRNVEDLMETLN